MPPVTRLKAKTSSDCTSTLETSTRKPPTIEAHKAKKKQSHFTTATKNSTRQLPSSQRGKIRKLSNAASTPPGKLTQKPPDNAIVHWPCNECPCPQGSFVPPVNACTFCGHDMDEHNAQPGMWDPNCDYVCGREELVAATLKMVLERRVVVIRATPQVGKTTLLHLLGRHILYEHPSLEPVWIIWQRKEAEGRDGLSCTRYLNREAERYRRENAYYRPHNPKARLIFLLDEAQNSYPEYDFWYGHLKNRDTRSTPLFVLVCVYGSAGTLEGRIGNVQSEAIKLDPAQRIELRPSANGQPHMLFTSNDTATVVKKWQTTNDYKLANGVCEYIQMATDGHPGMIGLILVYFDFRFKQVSNNKFRSVFY